MEKVKEPKANWDSAAHTVFMNACVEEVRANNRNGGYLSDIGQANLHKKFNERSGRNYSTRQIKNRWAVCRSEYNTWKTLIQQASGLGRAEHTHTIAATNEWWALEIKAHPEAAKFRYAPLAEEEKMSEVFDTTCVTNEHARVSTPSYQGDPSRISLEDDSGCDSHEGQFTLVQNRAKGGKKRACPYSPSPKMNDKWASENAKNEAFVRMVDIFGARDKRDAEEIAREKRDAEERAREKRDEEERAREKRDAEKRDVEESVD
uniref:Myb/SANT-like domain-containing protein n=2 Tax=Triticum urartu TaxID=4572 RepID=A0A8R7UNA5_TRIUA